MGQGQSSAKKLGRTSSKQLSPQDIADSLARTSIADARTSIADAPTSPPAPDSPAAAKLPPRRTPPSPAAIPTTQNIVAAPRDGFKSAFLGTSPPPPSAMSVSPASTTGPRGPSSPTPSGSPTNQTATHLAPGHALTQTVSRGSLGPGSTGAAGGLQVLDIDNMIQRLLEAGYSGKVTKSPPLKNAEIMSVCAAAREVFLSQPTLIELSPPVKIVGDVHGQVCRSMHCIHHELLTTAVRRFVAHV